MRHMPSIAALGLRRRHGWRHHRWPTAAPLLAGTPWPAATPWPLACGGPLACGQNHGLRSSCGPPGKPDSLRRPSSGNAPSSCATPARSAARRAPSAHPERRWCDGHPPRLRRSGLSAGGRARPPPAQSHMRPPTRPSLAACVDPRARWLACRHMGRRAPTHKRQPAACRQPRASCRPRAAPGPRHLAQVGSILIIGPASVDRTCISGQSCAIDLLGTSLVADAAVAVLDTCARAAQAPPLVAGAPLPPTGAKGEAVYVEWGPFSLSGAGGEYRLCWRPRVVGRGCQRRGRWRLRGLAGEMAPIQAADRRVLTRWRTR